MDTFQVLVLALIQGVTEFLPVSSSAHLILPSSVLNWPDQGLAFDTAVHLGTLIAVIWYFRYELISLTSAFFQNLLGRPTIESKFAINLLIASLPIIPVGFIIKSFVEGEFRSTETIIFTTVFFGLLLFAADSFSKKSRLETELHWRHALIIGVAQCFALIPGTSRSGVTMSLALLLGYTRESASRISFLLSIPAIAGASTLKTYDLIQDPTTVDWQSMAIGIIVAAISAYLCIRLFLDFINRIGFTPFVLYRLMLGALLYLLV
ncbi:MAG: undecaprenyl-diphosphate phosphatase [bacterium]|nr:undecaprenyl-diphosphate phosphatase [Gammaproteobacteria bacterium]HIL96428.1 undecaprenyl-diphosphate phosphatase [Pseudomonadales bacterium]